MTGLIPASFEDGAFKPVSPVRLPEHARVTLVFVVNDDDIPTLFLSRLAEGSASFHFLNDPREDGYTISDGEPC